MTITLFLAKFSNQTKTNPPAFAKASAGQPYPEGGRDEDSNDCIDVAGRDVVRLHLGTIRRHLRRDDLANRQGDPGSRHRPRVDVGTQGGHPVPGVDQECLRQALLSRGTDQDQGVQQRRYSDSRDSRGA